MGMRIRTNVPSLTSQRFLNKNSKDLNSSLEKLASGHRINKSADDAAGLAISEGIRAKVRGLNVAKRNANDAISMIQVAEGSLNEMSNVMIRLRELSVQAASDTIGTNERGILNREYNQLVSEIDRIAGTAEFNSLKLFDNPDKSEYVIQVGTNGSAPEDNIDTISIDFGGLKFTSDDLQLGTGAVIGPENQDDDAPSRQEIASKLGDIDGAIGRIGSERATLGAVQSRLNSSVNNLSISVENLQTAKSAIKDVDFAEETSKLAQARVLMASSTAVLSQANTQPEMALQLLR